MKVYFHCKSTELCQFPKENVSSNICFLNHDCIAGLCKSCTEISVLSLTQSFTNQYFRPVPRTFQRFWASKQHEINSKHSFYLAVLEFADLKTDVSSFYGYGGKLFVCDKDSKLHGGFYLLRAVKQSDLQGKLSGSNTPVGEVSAFDR